MNVPQAGLIRRAMDRQHGESNRCEDTSTATTITLAYAVSSRTLNLTSLDKKQRGWDNHYRFFKFS